MYVFFMQLYPEWQILSFCYLALIMGSFCNLYIGACSISWSKSAVNPLLLSLFQTGDFKTYTIEEETDQQLGEEKIFREIFEYSNSAKNIKDRLEIMGFTIQKVIEEFEIAKARQIEMNEGINSGVYSENHWVLSQSELLKKSTFQQFIEATKEIIEQNLRDTISSTSNSKNPLVAYLLHSEEFINFPFHYDERVLVRAMLDNIPDGTIVSYDITDLVHAGYYECAELVHSITIENYKSGHELGEKFLVLTEGSTDIEILKSTLKLLYPHLEEYYSFMDFGNANASGSAGSLVASVKSFVGAGIKNKIIAIFDNDTAAGAALLGLKKTAIPDNIRILKYPDIDIANNYPTIGPSGTSKMNINGLACSIELYLGKDILVDKDEFTPIHWKGYDPGTGRYQGEIINKQHLIDKFHEKVRACLSDRNLVNNYDWTEMDAILKNIFRAFN